MGLLKRLFMPEERRLTEAMIEDLIDDYNAELGLAHQLRSHAAEAPYRHAAEELRRIADLEESQAERIRDEIRRLGGTVAPPPAAPVRAGKNHWARLCMDLDDDRSAGKRYLEQAIRWDAANPRLSAFLRRLEHDEHDHRLRLQDLIAKSDPQATN